MSEWQPIETAPKDGEAVLLSGPVPAARKPQQYIAIGAYDAQEDVWCDPEEMSDWLNEPTHWQHLPPPPSLT